MRMEFLNKNKLCDSIFLAVPTLEVIKGRTRKKVAKKNVLFLVPSPLGKKV